MVVQTSCDIHRTVEDRLEVKLLWSATRKSYMSRRLAQQGITLNDLKWPFLALRAISAVAELLVFVTNHSSSSSSSSSSSYVHYRCRSKRQSHRSWRYC